MNRFQGAIAHLDKLGLLKPPKKPQGKSGRFSPEYLTYMKSPEWQAKRQERLKIDKFQCQACNSTKHLQVHHKHYRNLGHEPMEDLITLCKYCHGAITKSIRGRRSRH